MAQFLALLQPQRLKAVAALARPEVCGLQLDPTAGLLWNIEEIGIGEACP